MTSLAIRFQGVSKRFGRSTLALDRVTWSVPVGARACLLGPNGAGKSTSIRLLQGALEPTAGRVELLGAGIHTEAYLAARRRTGIVPQSPGMYQDLTVMEYLALARRLYGHGDIARAAAAFGLDAHREKRLSQLSGGFQRRLALATALLPEPDVLLLDEPTAGLDPVAASEVHAYLRGAMHEPGRTTLLCTHNLKEAEALCDQVVILRSGTVLLQSSLRDLRARARSRLRLAAAQGYTPLATALRRRNVQTVPDPHDPVALYVLVQEPRADAPALLRALLADGLDVYECRVEEPTLEALFLDVVRRPSIAQEVA